MAFIVVLVAAVLAGWLCGGRLRHLGAVSLRGGWLVAVSLFAQLAATASPPTVRTVLLAAGQVALVMFCWRNRSLPGVPLAAVGCGLNAAVILANGGMPVSAAALAAVGGSATVVGGPHRLLSPGDPLGVLADVIPVPPLAAVVSVGDLVLATGACILVITLMRRGGTTDREGSAGLRR